MCMQYCSWLVVLLSLKCVQATAVFQISRESIDVIKNYFRDEMSKADWQLIVELKKTFGIL